MSFFTALVTSKIAAGTLAAGALAVGGTGAAAYTGVLPDAVQQSAHNLLGAPAPHVGGVSATAKAAVAGNDQTKAESTETVKASSEGTADATATATATGQASTSPSPIDLPTGPDATGPAAKGLCQAYTKGGLDAASTAYKSLVTAAKGSTNIVTYCASLPGLAADSTAGADAAAKADSGTLPAVPAVPGTPAVPAVPAVPAAPVQVTGPQAPGQAVSDAVHELTGRR